jgi:hypothetical protein
MTNGIFFTSHPFRIDHNRQFAADGSQTGRSRYRQFSRSRSAICVEIAPFESAVNPEILRSRAVTCQNIPIRDADEHE